MGEDAADGPERSGEPEAIGVPEEDTDSQQEQEPVRAADIGAAGNDDQIETSLVSELGALDSGMVRPEAVMEEGSSHLFTDAMKLQLRAQILVLGDFLKGIAPNPDWLEDACFESAIGAESVLPEPADVSRDSQGVQCGNTCIHGIPTESNLQRISSAFRDAEAKMSSFSWDADVPIINDAIKHELDSTGTFSTPGRPSSSGKEAGFRDDSLAKETEIEPAGQLLITYDHARSNSSVPEDSRATESLILDNDKYLDLAQSSAQDALTTATSALAQSHLVWTRLHSQDHSDEGIARDARLASVAATVAAASSVAKAAVEAARAIAEVSIDAFIQASGYQLGDARTPQFGSSRSTPLQVDGWEQSPVSNARENLGPSQHRAEMLESVVQAAGKAAEAATQAGAVLAKANPMIQTTGLSEFWSHKADNGVVEHAADEANEMYAADEMNGLDGEVQVGALNEMHVVNELGVVHEKDALEKMENIQEKDTTHHDKLDAVNDVREQVIANEDEAVEDDVAAVIGDHVAANCDGVVGANEAGVVLANDLVEPFEQVKHISQRSRKMKRGRGRSRGVSSQAKRAKILVGVSSLPLPVQSPENAMREEVDVSECLEDVRDNNASGGKRGARHLENAPLSISGEDPPAHGPDGVTHETVEVVESEENARDRSSRAQKRGAKHIEKNTAGNIGEGAPATALDRSPEDKTLKQDDVSVSRKNTRGKKRGAKHTEKKSVSATGEDMPTTSPAQSPENEVHKQDDISTGQEKARGEKRGAKHIESRPVSTTGEHISAGEPAESPQTEMLKQDDALKSRRVFPGKKRGAKHIENRPMTATEEDILATAPTQIPENGLHKKDKIPKSRKNVEDGNARGRTRRAKLLAVSASRKATADRDVGDPETVANTLEGPDSALREGSVVEVMVDEVGLRGGWFSGTVLRIVANETFVELLDLLTDDGKSNVREWFPLVEGFNTLRPRRHVRPVHPFTIFSEAGSRKRRRVALGSQTWQIGDQVDAFIQDAWWEGIVAEINDLDPTKATVYFPEENDTQVVKTFNLRPSFQWKDYKWIPWKSPALVEDERPQKRHRTNMVVTPDEMNGKGKSSEERAEGSRIPEAIPETPKSPVQGRQGSKATLPRSNWKKMNKKIVSPDRRGRSANKAHQTDVLSPGGASKRIDFTATATASARGKTLLTKGKLRGRRKKHV